MTNIQLKPINEQVVVVFGASSGIGRATALKFAERGAKVVVAARGEAGLQSLVAEIREKDGTAEYSVADAAEFEQVKRVADFAAEKYGRLDTSVGAAGVWVTAKFTDTKPEEFRRILEVNLLGQAHGIWAALPHLTGFAASSTTNPPIFPPMSPRKPDKPLKTLSARCGRRSKCSANRRKSRRAVTIGRKSNRCSKR